MGSMYRGITTAPVSSVSDKRSMRGTVSMYSHLPGEPRSVSRHRRITLKHPGSC